VWSASRSGKSARQRRLGPRRRLSLRSLWADYHWYLLAVLFLLALALGMVGFRRHFDASGDDRSFADLLYLALRLFPLESGDVAPPVPWELNVARFLAPAVALSAALQALAAVFRDELQALRARFWRGHVVVCGLGEKGRLIAESFREQGERVVAVEPDPSSPHVAAARAHGIAVVAGDAREQSVLRRAGAERARYVVAVAGTDATNARIAAQTRDLVADRRGHAVVTALVHVVDADLCDLLAASGVARGHRERFRLEFFNVFERGARAWLSEHPPFTEGNDHLVVVGSDELARALVVGAARDWLTANPDVTRRPRITLVDADADTAVELLSLRYPALVRLCDLVPHAIDVASPELARAPFLGDAAAVYVCLEDEGRGLAAALSLGQRLRGSKVALVTRVARAGGFPELVRAYGELEMFSLLERTCTAEQLAGRTRNEIIARAMHEEYCRKQAAEGQTPATNPSMVEWEQLPESLRESNRRQADHIPAKLEAIGCALAPLEEWSVPTFALSSREIEQLARLEHDRWMAERLLDGWAYAPGPKDLRRKRTPWLIPWEEMPEEQRDYDRNTVRNLPRFLAQAGLRIVRVDGAARGADAPKDVASGELRGGRDVAVDAEQVVRVVDRF
jgi:voltage-gated potassium channel Kch